MNPKDLDFLDRQIFRFSPKTIINRLAAEEQMTHFSYGDGSGASRNGTGSTRGRRATQSTQGSSESWRKTRRRYQAIWEARLMEENFCIVAGVLERLSQYVIGSLSYQPATAKTKVNKLYREYFEEWAKKPDITGRHNLRVLSELALRSLWRDGEFGFVERFQKNELKLQCVESDRIGNPGRVGSGSNDRNVQGIWINPKTGAVEKYELWKRDRNNHWSFDVNVSPRRFIHIFRPTRSDQYHGVSLLAPALPHARDLYELFGHEKVAAKFAASFAAFVKTRNPYEEGGALAWDYDPKTGGAGGRMNALSGQIIRLDDRDEDIEFAPGTQRPSGAFMALVDALIRELSIGLNLPYGFVYDMSRLGGVSARLETAQAQRTFNRFRDLLVSQFLDRVKNDVLTLGIAKGEIPAVRDYKKGRWLFSPAITGDVGHQTQADAALVSAGVKSISDWANEVNGGTINEVFEENAGAIKQAMEISKREGIPLEMLIRDLPGATESLAAMERAKKGISDEPAPAPGMVGTHGEKGVKLLLETLQSYGRGELDRASTVLLLVQSFGIPLPEAELIVPEKNADDKTPVATPGAAQAARG